MIILNPEIPEVTLNIEKKTDKKYFSNKKKELKKLIN